MAHTVWSGAISFGLVHVPVKATVATKDHSIRFVQLHAEDGERIQMRRTCPEHGEIPFEEVTKGYPLGAGEYVVVTKQELADLEPERSRTIEIEDFVELAEVDPVYFDRTYHLVPDAGGAKAYRLLVEALQETGRIAVGRFVLRNKEHLVALRVWDGGLVMETLHFADEVLPLEEDARPVGKEPTKKERDMAVRLVQSLSRPFDPAMYQDTYRRRLSEFIEAKAEGETVKVPEAPRGTVIEDLEAALEKSLQEIGAK